MLEFFIDLHYLSPSGCTFWGKKPWSRKKKLICQLGTLVGAPVGIALLAGISVGFNNTVTKFFEKIMNCSS